MNTTKELPVLLLALDRNTDFLSMDHVCRRITMHGNDCCVNTKTISLLVTGNFISLSQVVVNPMFLEYSMFVYRSAWFLAKTHTHVYNLYGG